LLILFYMTTDPILSDNGFSCLPHWPFSDHARVAKKRLMVIFNTRKDKARLAIYRELLWYANRVIVYAEAAIPTLWSLEGSDSLVARSLACNIERAVGILRKVVDQTVRRVIMGEKVTAWCPTIYWCWPEPDWPKPEIITRAVVMTLSWE
jgi:hypothetical protein